MQNKPWSQLVIIVFAACLTGFASEIYAPSLLSIANEFGESVDHVQATIAVYMLGSCLFQLVYGPLSDLYGRRLLLLVGLVLFMLGSMLAYSASSLNALYAARLIQGVGVAAPATLWRSLFRDQFSGADLVKYAGYLGSVMVVVIPLAPLLGGYFDEHLGWRASFVCLLVYATIFAGYVLYACHDHPPQHETQGSRGHWMQGLRHVLLSKQFMVHALAVFFMYGAFLAWFTSAPVLYMSRLGLGPKDFGWIAFITTALCMISGNMTVAHSVKRFGSLTMMRAGLFISVVAAFGMFAVEVFGWVSVPSMLVLAFVYFFGTAFVWTTSFAGAMAPFSSMAGTAAALYGTIQALGGFMASAVVVWLPENTLYPMATLLWACPVIALVLSRWLPQEEQTS